MIGTLPMPSFSKPGIASFYCSDSGVSGLENNLGWPHYYHTHTNVILDLQAELIPPRIALTSFNLSLLRACTFFEMTFEKYSKTFNGTQNSLNLMFWIEKIKIGKIF